MPKIVDRDAMKRSIALAAHRVVMRDGLEAATVRAIAREAGYSTNAPLHYFDSRDEIIEHAFEVIGTKLLEVARAHAAGAAPGLDRLRAVVSTFMPFHSDAARSFTTFLRYLILSSTDPRMAKLQRRYYEKNRGLVAAALREAVAVGDLDAGIDATAEAMQLLATSDGLALAAFTHDGPSVRRRMRLAMEATIDRLPRGPGKRAATRSPNGGTP